MVVHIPGADNARHSEDKFLLVIFDRPTTILGVVDDMHMDGVVVIFENGSVVVLVPSRVLNSAIGQVFSEVILLKRIPT